MAAQQNKASWEKEREAGLVDLYRNVFPFVAKFVSGKGGSLEQAKDVFQDAIVVWYERSGAPGKFNINSDVAYLLGIAKNVWYKRFSLEKGIVPLDPRLGEELEESTGLEPSSTKILRLLEASGRKCMDMLKSFYYDKHNMAELAVEYGFRSIRSATVQKFKCLEKVRETVKLKSLSYEDFLE